jgi:hypothetical protein
MGPLQIAIVLAAAGVAVCLLLFASVTWYTFVLFMLVAQPLFLVAFALYAWSVLRGLKRGTP